MNYARGTLGNVRVAAAERGVPRLVMTPEDAAEVSCSNSSYDRSASPCAVSTMYGTVTAQPQQHCTLPHTTMIIHVCVEQHSYCDMIRAGFKPH